LKREQQTHANSRAPLCYIVKWLVNLTIIGQEETMLVRHCGGDVEPAKARADGVPCKIH